MQFTGLIKRILPFVLTFSAGLLLASLFVPIGLPNLGTRSESRRGRHHREHRDMQMEIDRLREQLRNAEVENEQLRRSATESIENFELGESPLEAPHPPPPPRRPKHPRFEIQR